MLLFYVLILKDYQLFCCTKVMSVGNLSSFFYIMMVLITWSQKSFSALKLCNLEILPGVLD